MKLRKFHILSVLAVLLIILYNCSNNTVKKEIEEPKKDSLSYLNHSDTAHYVGINTCKLCHQDIYNTFIKTGMGKSFDVASVQKTSAKFDHPVIYDKFSDFYYKAFWQKDSLKFLEYRLEGRDTVYKRIERVDYIIGSGQHTNSHIQSVNGYFNQMPMTFYTQKGEWHLPPGFEEGHNSRFRRKIGLECMTCHNAYPDFVEGSENKYASVPNGINCERCHGPGSVHVQQRSSGSRVDTSKFIDYSIVNPAKLSIDLQFDLCQRCHLQGNAILKEGKSFYDFKPGMKLSDYISVFLPRYKNADDEFIMASHADRLKQSQCFIKTFEKAKNSTSLKPYKEAMTCVTCHNPHVSVRETNGEIFNDACKNCHRPNGKSELDCTDKGVIAARNAAPGHAPADLLNCVGCHMPKSGSIDIPHVTVHDHYIRKPITKKEKEKIKEFIGLFSINEKDPDKLTKARAYISQYEKFEWKPYYLDSALQLLPSGSKE
ncbi:MAG: multiheme c-type cytochrome, partial [Bacteroidia bacterium]